MHRLLPLVLIAVAAPATAQVREIDNRIIGEASELVSWCKEEARAHAFGQGREVYQWTASHRSEVDTLQVDGRLQLDGGSAYVVTCRIARGARAHYGSIEIVESPP